MSGPERYTFDDYRYGMPPRAFGSETEYTHKGYLLRIVNGVHELGIPSTHLLHYVDPSVAITHGRRRVSDTTNSGVITATGGEIYVDGGLLEYATPECQTPQELVLHERAGEQIVYDTFRRIAEADESPMVEVYKRSGYAKVVHAGETIMEENSCGNHENYTSINDCSSLNDADQIDHLSSSKSALLFADFLALRKLIDGVGMVDTYYYSISQKPRAIDFRGFGHQLGHGVKKPFFQHNSRLEVRSGEGNKSDWAKECIVGLTSLVFRLIEHDAYPEDLMLHSANQSLTTLARNPLGDVALASGDKMKGIDVLRRIVDAAVDIGLASPDFPKYEQKAAADFYAFYNDLHQTSLRDGDVTSLADRIDWAARFQYLVDKGARHSDLHTANFDAVRADLKWDRIGDSDIARRRFRQLGHTALYVPIPHPPHTRASARVNALRDIQARNESIYEVTWSHITTGAGKYHLGGSLDSETTLFTPNKPIG